MKGSKAVYSVENIRRVEQAAFELVSEQALMSQAGQAAFDLILELYPEIDQMVIFCGGGNNGGDGLVVAKLADAKGIDVQVYQLGDPKQYSEVAYAMYQAVLAQGVPVQSYADRLILEKPKLIVDAMLGIGLTGEVRGAYVDAIHLINRTGSPIFSIDVPSGLNADTGQPLGHAVEATHTLTYIGHKLGLVTGAGKHYCGELHLNTLGIEPSCFDDKQSAELIDKSCLANRPKLRLDAHKGTHGHVIVVAGDKGMAGAACLAAQAALRMGAGKVTVVTRPEHVSIIVCRQAELMTLAIDDDEESYQALQALLAQGTVCLIGPGLTIDSPWSLKVIELCTTSALPKVIDAGALHYLAEAGIKISNAVLTPHPGEAGTLLSTSAQEIEADRYRALQTLSKKCCDNVVLKGAGSLIQLKQSLPQICRYGNPGMATAGMGDVLAGMIAGWMGLGCDIQQATILGVTLHARCADLAAKELSEQALVASDLLMYIGAAL